jgi:hypothetical protein
MTTSPSFVSSFTKQERAGAHPFEGFFLASDRTQRGAITNGFSAYFQAEAELKPLCTFPSGTVSRV